MKIEVAQAKAAVVELKKQIKFKTEIIELTEDLMMAEELLVPEAALIARKNRNTAERDALVLELKLTEQFLAMYSGQEVFLS